MVCPCLLMPSIPLNIRGFVRVSMTGVGFYNKLKQYKMEYVGCGDDWKTILGEKKGRIWACIGIIMA